VACTAASCSSNELALNNLTTCNGGGACTAASSTNCPSGNYCKSASCSNPRGASGATCTPHPSNPTNPNVECQNGLACTSNSTGGYRCCATGLACNGSCADPTSDATCGSCTRICGSNTSCQSGQCLCSAGTLSCGGCAGSNFDKTAASTFDGWSISPDTGNQVSSMAVVNDPSGASGKSLRLTVDNGGFPLTALVRWNMCPSGSTTVNSVTFKVYSTVSFSLGAGRVYALDGAGNEGAQSTTIQASVPVGTWTPISVTFSPGETAYGLSFRMTTMGQVSGNTLYLYLDDVRIQ
jgi:hypothetical protein